MRSIYKVVGKPIDKRKTFLDKPIQQARIGITSGQYISIGVVGLVFLIIAMVILYLIMHNLLLLLLLPIYTVIFLLYPFWKVSNRASEISKEIPHALNYLSIMVVVGINISKAFQFISEESSFGEIRKEFHDIYREIEFFGADISTALLRAAGRTPSKELSSTLNNIIAMIAAGSDIGTVLRNTAEIHLNQHYRKLNRLVDNLSLFAEIYIILAVFVPILFMIAYPIVEVMNSFFTTTFGTESMQFMSRATSEALIYLIIPCVSLISIILLEVIIPEDMKV